MGLDLGLERAPMGSPDALRRPLGRPPESPAGALLGVGRVAQRQSASLTRRRPQVQPLPRPPGLSRGFAVGFSGRAAVLLIDANGMGNATAGSIVKPSFLSLTIL